MLAAPLTREAPSPRSADLERRRARTSRSQRIGLTSRVPRLLLCRLPGWELMKPSDGWETRSPTHVTMKPVSSKEPDIVLDHRFPCHSHQSCKRPGDLAKGSVWGPGVAFRDITHWRKSYFQIPSVLQRNMLSTGKKKKGL